MENLEAIAAIIGLVNGIRLVQEKDKTSFYMFLAAVGIGVLAGWIGYFGLTIETGIVAALASSGLYRAAQKVGGE